jgi:hypothetical protein
MDEYISAAVLGLNESMALRRVEPFHGASSHLGLLVCTNLIAAARPSCDRPSEVSVAYGKAHREVRDKMAERSVALPPEKHEEAMAGRSRAEYYRGRAIEAQERAAQATNLAIKEAFKDVARSWFVLAEQTAWLDRERDRRQRDDQRE